MMRYFIKFLFVFILASSNCYAIFSPTAKYNREDEKTILKADTLEGDRDQNIITAIGHVEVVNGPSKATSERMSYDKNTGWIKAYENVRITDIEIGKILTNYAEIKDDFTQGSFPDSVIIFNDGSYLKSRKVEKKSSLITVLTKPIFSICPNDKIVQNNENAGKLFDLLSIKSSKTTIDQEKQVMRTTNGIVRIYNFPVFYTPYLSVPMKNSERKSGFLAPTYLNNSNFGIGANIPYFVDVAPNIDLTVTPRLYKNSDQITIKNEVYHILKYGEYKASLEVSNNEIRTQTNTTVVKRTDKEYRYDFRSSGALVFTENSSVKHNIHTIGDRDYLRDYNFDFNAFTTSKINYDYTKGREYLGVKTIRFQELESTLAKQAQWALPSITYYKESGKSLFFKEKYALSTNFTTITRESGLQYRRLTVDPSVKIPLNFYGNLIDLTSKVAIDYYSLDNNYKFGETHADYKQSQSNYKPEFSAMWRLPLIQKTKSNTLMLEPTVNFVSSSFKKNYLSLPNEDSNNSELTVNNLFVNDRIAGYDRNEAGERISYGAKSAMFNRLGQFELTLGQSYRISERVQDVSIRGFNNNNKSNIVGQVSYILPQYFNATYLFQLNESNYKNEVNSLITNLTLKRLTIGNNYLLIRKGVINPEEIAQDTFNIGFKFTPRFRVLGSVTKNLVTNKNLMRSATLEYEGCCVVIKFMTTENNTSNLTKTQRSHSINIAVKNL